MKETVWHNLENNEVLDNLHASIEGLTKEEVEKRINIYGKNELPKKKTDSIFKILLRQLLDPIVILLCITVIFSLVIGEMIDAGVILFIIAIDLIMATVQEWKAEKTAETLSNFIKAKTSVLRDGSQTEIASENLVVGDIVLLESGDKISADLRILECTNLQIDESVLTGESMASEKDNDPLPAETLLAERKNMAYAGCNVTTGRAKGIVVATGIHTELGHIATTVTGTKKTKSPLTIRMEKFSRQIAVLIVIVALIIAYILIMKKVPGNEIFLSVIALSVSAMPEGLPLALTMALTIASNKMAKKHVIVKRLNSVESLGSCTVIASDKTGTLTVNEQTAKKILLPDGSTYIVEGSGYQTNGNIIAQKGEVTAVQSLISLGVWNNEAGWEEKNGIEVYYGDSVDIAFLVLGKKANIDADVEILAAIPYESQNKYSAIFYRKGEELRCTVKGSIEKVLTFCTSMKEKTSLDREFLNRQNVSLAQEGYRVIALADGPIDHIPDRETVGEKDIPSLVFEGMVAFIDPIREEVKASIEECRTSGIKVVMITGDHPLTAYAIAQELGLAQDYTEVTTGEEVGTYLQKGKLSFDRFVKEKRIFTRVTPLQKLEIVESYKRQGEFIAVTGDGVNDAPALKSANIGIAMGSGTDVAKETASMIIIDDNFKSIVAGIKEGRTAYSNIRKVSYMLLSCGLAEVLFFILSILSNLPMPLIAIQLLWLNIVTNGLQDFALSFEKSEKGIMQEPPRNTKESVFNKDLLGEVCLAGVVIGLTVFFVWNYLIRTLCLDVTIARGYIMVLMVFMQNIHVLNCRSEKQSAFTISLKKNPLVIFSILSAIILQVIVMEVPLFSKFLQTSPVPFTTLWKLFGLSLIILLVMEIYKAILRMRKKPQKS